MSMPPSAGDGGQNRPAGGIRVSKTHPAPSVLWTIDELISANGFRTLFCQDADVCERLETIQRELYKSARRLPRHPNPRKLHRRSARHGGRLGS